MSETLPTIYVEGEGPAYLDQCMAAAFSVCKDAEIKVLVVFTSTGEGPSKALDEYLHRDDFSATRVVAVTPPVRKQYRDAFGALVRAGIPAERSAKLHEAGISIVSARLPFRSIVAQPDPIAESEGGALPVPPTPNFDAMHAVDRALGIFGGGISLCVQAVLMACDAGAVAVGERVVAMSADTAIVARACQSESFFSPLTGLLVEHIICRPQTYTISKRHHYATQAWVDEATGDEDDNGSNEDALLPAGADVPELPPAKK